MQTKVEKLKDSKVKLTVTVQADELVKYFNQAYDELSPTVKLAGFRPGKAPRTMVESSLGVSRILSQAIDNSLQDNYVKALEKEKLMPVAQPSISISKYPNYGLNEEEIGSELEFEAEIEVMPEVILGDYSKLKVTKTEPEKVKSEDVEKVLEHLRKQKATFTDIDRPAQKGDFAEVSYEGSIDHIKKDQMSSKNHPLVLGENTLIPGFEDQIIGMKKYDEKKFKIKFSEDYNVKEFAGAEAEFLVTLNELKKINLPEIDDDFAAAFGRKSASDLRQAISDNLKKELEEKNRIEMESKVIEKILPMLKTEIPAALVEEETGRMIHQYEHQFKERGISFETYLKSTKKTLDEMKKEMRPQAEKNVQIGLLLGKIIEDQKIDHKDPEAGRKALAYLVGVITEK